MLKRILATMPLALAILATVPQPCVAGPTMWVAGNVSGSYSQDVQVTAGVPFGVAVFVDSDDPDISAVKFSMLELSSEFSSVFWVGTSYATQVSVDLGDLQAGEHYIVLGGCAPACNGRLIAEYTYIDFTGEIPQDTIIRLSGTGPSADGPPSIQSCGGAWIDAPMGGGPGAYNICDPHEPYPAGALILNQTICRAQRPARMANPRAPECDQVVSARAESFGLMKGRFGHGQ